MSRVRTEIRERRDPVHENPEVREGSRAGGRGQDTVEHQAE